MTTTTSTTLSTMTTSTRISSGPVDPIGADLARTLCALKLSGPEDTLPERLALTWQHSMGHAALLELLLMDEVTRREGRSAMLRAAKASLDPSMRAETWDEPADLRYNRGLWSDLASLRFADVGTSVLILGPVGVGKTHLATALSHAAIRHRQSVMYSRADNLFTRLRAARLDNTLDAEMRRITTADVLILDDFALKPLDATQTSDFYELVVERHRKKSTIWVYNREPAEWFTMTTDTLLAQSAVDRLTSGAHHLIIEGPSYRQRQRVALDTDRGVRDAR